MEYLPGNKKKSRGMPTVSNEAAICKLYGEIVLPCVISTWTVCVFGVIRVSAMKR
jgi:hypothetical protein